MASGSTDNSLAGDGLIDDAGIEGYSSLYEQLRSMKRERGITSESGDPNELMYRERAANDAEFEGLPGLLRYGVHEFYGLFRSGQDPGGAEEAFKSAEQASRSTDQKIEATTEGDKNKNAIHQLASQLQGQSLLAQQPNDVDREALLAQMQHGQASAEIEQFKSLPYYAFNGLFKSQQEQDNAVSQLTLEANIPFERAVTRFQDQDNARRLNDQDLLNAAKLEASGDTTGARRAELDEQLSAQERSLDSHDIPEVTRLKAIHGQMLTNFDAEAHRQANLQAAQSNDRIAAMREEAKDAQLRGEGETDEAKISDLKFQTEQRVRSLQEQADAEGDSTKKAQLQREAAAAAEAGKTERDALQKELQRQNSQAPALANSSQTGGGTADTLATRIEEASAKLNSAADKLDHALSNLKTNSILKV
jgi:hypothetical protein